MIHDNFLPLIFHITFPSFPPTPDPFRPPPLRRIDRAVVRHVPRGDPLWRDGGRRHRGFPAAFDGDSLPLRQLRSIQPRHRGGLVVVATGTSRRHQSLTLSFYARCVFKCLCVQVCMRVCLQVCVFASAFASLCWMCVCWMCLCWMCVCWMCVFDVCVLGVCVCVLDVSGCFRCVCV